MRLIKSETLMTDRISGLSYAVGIQSSTTLCPPGIVPLSPRPKDKRGRPPQLLRREEQHQPLSAKDLVPGRDGLAQGGADPVVRTVFCSLLVEVLVLGLGRQRPRLAVHTDCDSISLPL